MNGIMNWSFYQIWNESLENRAVRPMQQRDRIWAGEVGGAFVDRYLKMKGTTPTNPPNPRSLRKFEAGNIWECIIGYVLRRAGILKDKQEWLKYQYPGLLSVTGKLDFVAGGMPDYDRAVTLIHKEFEWLPKAISKATERIVASLKEQYPEGLKDIILEIKSCSSFMFDLYERNKTGSPNHKYQLFHYLKCKNYDEGHIVYVSKDDARLIEIGVFNPSVIEAGYRQDIIQMTAYYHNDRLPPLEPTLKFDEEFCKFSANWKVGYSQYLTHLYSLKNQKEFDDIHKPIAERWNRVLGRILEGKTLTENNKQALNEVKKRGFNIDKIVAIVEEKKKKLETVPEPTSTV